MTQETKRVTPFSNGRRWFCDRDDGRARFWFVVEGPGTTYDGKPSSQHKRCRIEIHPVDLEAMAFGYRSHGNVSTYSHKHLRKHGKLEPLDAKDEPGAVSRPEAGSKGRAKSEGPVQEKSADSSLQVWTARSNAFMPWVRTRQGGASWHRNMNRAWNSCW